MKTKPTQNSIPGVANGPAALSHVKQRSGVALLIVLGMLVLLSVIVLAFVESVTKDLADSQSYASEINTRMLADSALNLVEMEIRAASTGTNQAWISQPGLLRTFDTNGGTVAYKLYSASQMVVNGAFDPNAGTDLPNGGNTWLNQPNLYTDLNSPVASGTTSTGSTNYVFPIIDGNGIQSISVSGSQQLTYTTDGVLPTIEGFSTLPSKVGITYNAGTALSATNNPVPMPVQWLYMLKDGTLIPATGVGNSKDVTFNGTILPSGTNPIVARIAFWTDDESCKVNINTASEGTFWDTPVCVSQPNVQAAGNPDPVGKSVFDPNQIFEWDLAQRQANRNEYQRYPGHPATTCLSPVLGDTLYKNLNLKGLATSGTGAGYHSLTGTGWARFTEFINQLAPRVSGLDASSTSFASGNDVSSRGGTYRPGGTGVYSANKDPSFTSGTSGQAITPDQDRLYADVDEYFYSGTFASSGTSRAFNGAFMTGSNISTSGTIVPVLTPSLLAKSRFFLTANSNSPELNVFNLPRVSIWPITKNLSTIDNTNTSLSTVTATMTAFDKVIAFCATVGMSGSNSITGTIPFYFVRYDPFSTTNDYQNSPNNQRLYNYLYNFLQKPYPGLSSGASATFRNTHPLEDKGSATSGNQILTEIFDYIRCTNLADCTEDPASTSPKYGAKSYTMVNPTYAWTDQQWGSQTSQGQVAPLVIGSTRGVGRIPVVGEMTMILEKEDERINSGAAEDGAPQNTIVVAQGSTYSGTWTFKNPQPNRNNVLLKEANKGDTYSNSPNGMKGPPQDYPLVPGPGGLSGANTTGTTSDGKNTYDPRTQTKIQIVLAPYYFCPMAGFTAIGSNMRLHWTSLRINAVGNGSGGPSNTGNVAISPSPTGTYASGTQGEDLYDSGRIDTINMMESKIGGPMGPKTLINSSTSGNFPTNVGAPFDSMLQTQEVVVNGTSTGTFSGTSTNTMRISGSGVLQVLVPGVTVPSNPWSTMRGVAGEAPAVIQTTTFSWPQTTVQIPSLDNNGNNAYPFVALQSATATLSGNANTAQSMPIASGTNVKVGISRMNPSTGWQDYNSQLLFPNGKMGEVLRSLQLSGTGVMGDFRLVAASAGIPATWYQPIAKYTASGTSVPIAAGSTTGSAFTNSGTTPYYDQKIQYQYGWRTCIFYGGTWLYATPPGQLISTGTTGNVSFPLYVDNRFSPYVPLGINGVYNSQGSPGDWDNGPGWVVDGAYCNKPDEGWIRHWEAQKDFVASSIAPFIGHAFCAEDSAAGLPSFYAPNKMVSSPVMFGSLPTGVLANAPWQTLLFRPAKDYLPGGSNGSASSATHPGAAVGAGGGQSPGTGVIAYPPYSKLPDHVLLDLFWMPVVDPYPISEPFATSGKVNLNYQIAPFTYITRNTALRAVLQSVKITAMNPTTVGNAGAPSGFISGGVKEPANPQFSQDYKLPGSYGNKDDTNDDGVGDGGGVGICVRRNIDLDSTIKEIDVLRFGTSSSSVNKPFITASEICDVPLIPGDLPTVGTAVPYNIGSRIKSASPSGYDAILADFWFGNSSATFGHRLTGDNSLERPYSMIYPRLTTKSNTYTVHVRVQTLKKSSNTPATLFKDGVDAVTGEFRGSFVIERYLDPATAGFYSGTTPVSFSSVVSSGNTGAQLGPYKFRVVSSKQFGQ